MVIGTGGTEGCTAGVDEEEEEEEAYVLGRGGGGGGAVMVAGLRIEEEERDLDTEAAVEEGEDPSELSGGSSEMTGEGS